MQEIPSKGRIMNQEVSWNMVCEKIRRVWAVYHSIGDESTKKEFDKAMGDVMMTIAKIHGFVPEDTK
jgi:hypothetical protein